MIDFDGHDAPADMKSPEALFTVAVFVSFEEWGKKRRSLNLQISKSTLLFL